MAYPTKYARQYDFQSYQNANPTRPLPGDKINVDFNYVVSSIGDLVDFVKLFARSDGLIRITALPQTSGLDEYFANAQVSIDASAAAAAASATEATGSASTASSAASGAATSESNAAGSASAASGAASDAASSATAAASSASDAASSATAAASSASSASASASAASTSASNAAASEASAAGSASAAASSASDAAGSASAAASSASDAADYATVIAGQRYSFETSTTMAAPAAGGLRFNNATAGSVTALAISAQTADSGNPNILNFLLALADSTNVGVKGTITLRKLGAPATFVTVNVLGEVTNNTSWVQVSVAVVASNGSWSAADGISFQFQRAGDASMGLVSTLLTQTAYDALSPPDSGKIYFTAAGVTTTNMANLVYLTQAAYDALGAKNATTIYAITDA